MTVSGYLLETEFYCLMLVLVSNQNFIFGDQVQHFFADLLEISMKPPFLAEDARLKFEVARYKRI